MLSIDDLESYFRGLDGAMQQLIVEFFGTFWVVDGDTFCWLEITCFLSGSFVCVTIRRQWGGTLITAKGPPTQQIDPMWQNAANLQFTAN